MKKFVCIILSVLFIIPCFAFPASADDSSSTFSPEDYLSLIPPSRDAPCIVAVKRSDDGKSVRISYIYPLDFPSGGTIDYHTDTDTYCTTNDYVYQSDYYAYSITENKITASGSSTLPSTSSLSLKRFVSTNGSGWERRNTFPVFWSCLRTETPMRTACSGKGKPCGT